MDQVWYVAYGSNLSWRRFGCYLSGGRPEGGNRTYVGSRDPSAPVRTESLLVPGQLVFAERSGVWGGGMAFYDRRGAGRVACRAYLVTVDQFADVTAQEMRRPPGGDFARELAGLLRQVESVHTLGPGRYETVTRVGVRDGVPQLTVTHAEVARLEPASPTSAYLRWIARGLREAHRWSPGRIGSYLAGSPGAMGSWTPEEVADLAARDATRGPSD